MVPTSKDAVAAPPYTTRLMARHAMPIPSAQGSIETLVGAFVGAGVSAVLITKVFPRHQSVMAIASAPLFSILAAASPIGSIPEDVGIGGAVFSFGWLVLRAFNEIKIPTATSGAALAVDIPPLRLPDGRQIQFHRTV